MDSSRPKNASFNLQVDQELASGLVVHKNMSQDAILTTVDKVKLNLIEHQAALAARTDWIGPLGIVITILATLITTDFRQFLALSPEVWKGLFISTLVGSFGWLVYNLNRFFKYRNYSNEKFVKALQGREQEHSKKNDNVKV